MAMRQPTKPVDIRQLKEQTADVLRRVDEGKEIIDVIDGGRVVARLIPVPAPRSDDERQAIWQRRRQLAKAVGESWIGDVSAADAVAEGRRDLCSFSTRASG